MLRKLLEKKRKWVGFSGMRRQMPIIVTLVCLITTCNVNAVTPASISGMNGTLDIIMGILETDDRQTIVSTTSGTGMGRATFTRTVLMKNTAAGKDLKNSISELRRNLGIAVFLPNLNKFLSELMKNVESAMQKPGWSYADMTSTLVNMNRFMMATQSLVTAIDPISDTKIVEIYGLNLSTLTRHTQLLTEVTLPEQYESASGREVTKLLELRAYLQNEPRGDSSIATSPLANQSDDGQVNDDTTDYIPIPNFVGGSAPAVNDFNNANVSETAINNVGLSPILSLSCDNCTPFP